MKKLMVAMMLGSTAMAGAALAQDTNATTTDAALQADTAMQNEGGFITWQSQDQMIASNLMGASVWGADNQTIGSVDDLLLDREGQIIGVIVGIGGFLGIGQRDVAISTDQLEFVLAQDVAAAGGAPGAAAPADMAGQNTGVPAQTGDMTGTGTAGTVAPAETGTLTQDQAGTTADGMAPAGAGGMTGMGAGDPNAGMRWTGGVLDHVRVNFTREQLEEAPAFERVE
jgi:hypothetical protein